MAPVVWDRKGEHRKLLKDALGNGFIRARVNGEVRSLEDEISLARYEKHTIEIVIDRLRATPEKRGRLVEAIETGLSMADGLLTVLVEDEHRVFSPLEAALTTASPSRRWSRGCSPSTLRRVPARPAMVWGRLGGLQPRQVAECRCGPDGLPDSARGRCTAPLHYPESLNARPRARSSASTPPFPSRTSAASTKTHSCSVPT